MLCTVAIRALISNLVDSYGHQLLSNETVASFNAILTHHTTDVHGENMAYLANSIKEHIHQMVDWTCSETSCY